MVAVFIGLSLSVVSRGLLEISFFVGVGGLELLNHGKINASEGSALKTIGSMQHLYLQHCKIPQPPITRLREKKRWGRGGKRKTAPHNAIGSLLQV